MILAALMPWGDSAHRFGRASFSGIEGGGLLTLIIGGFVAVAAWLRMDHRRWRAGRFSATSFAEASIGGGLYLTFFAAVVTGVAVLIENTNRVKSGSNSPASDGVQAGKIHHRPTRGLDRCQRRRSSVCVR